jgi:hypothetical protein
MNRNDLEFIFCLIFSRVGRIKSINLVCFGVCVVRIPRCGVLVCVGVSFIIKMIWYAWTCYVLHHNTGNYCSRV